MVTRVRVDSVWKTSDCYLQEYAIKKAVIYLKTFCFS